MVLVVLVVVVVMAWWWWSGRIDDEDTKGIITCNGPNLFCFCRSKRMRAARAARRRNNPTSANVHIGLIR